MNGKDEVTRKKNGADASMRFLMTIDCLALLSVSIDLLRLTGFTTTMLCFWEPVFHFPCSRCSLCIGHFPETSAYPGNSQELRNKSKHLWATNIDMAVSPLSKHVHEVESPLELSAQHNSSELNCDFPARHIRSSKCIRRSEKNKAAKERLLTLWHWQPQK